VGPAGCGKSHGAQLCAKILNARFGTNNFSEGVTETDLYGFRHVGPQGTEYIVPELSFADLYEHGGGSTHDYGLWFGDEYDRANPNVVVSLNPALANGHLNLPKRMGATVARKHERFLAMVASNTWGLGPSSEYTSANKQDASALDRFRVGTIYVDYDRKLESHLMPDKALLTRVWKLRETVMALGLRRIVSTRFIKDAATGVHALGWTHDKVMHLATQDWSEADKQKVSSI
jgi:cobaltochelatase CobS